MKILFVKPQNLIFILLLLTFILYYQTVYSLYYLWMESGNPAYSHGSLAFLIGIYIFGRFWFFQSTKPNSKAESSTVEVPIHAVQFDVIGLCFLFGACLLWLLSTLGNIQVLQQLSLLGAVGFLFWACFGFGVFRKLSIPLFIMLTTIPIWDFMDFYLQHITAIGVSSLLEFTTIPFVKEGVQILLQSGTFEIADRCSGLRMVTAIVPVALLYSYQWNFKGWVTANFVLFSILVAIFANIVRILIVVIAGHLTNMQHYFVTTDHVTLGWIVFGVIVLVFIYLSNKIFITEKLYPRIVAKKKEPINSVESFSENFNRQQSATKIISVFLISGLVVVAGPVLANVLNKSYQEIMSDSISLPDKLGNWESVAENTISWNPKFRGSDFELKQKFKDSNQAQVDLFLAFYQTQMQGKEAIHFENRPFDSVKWRKLYQKKLTREFEQLGELSVIEYRVQALTGQKKLIWQWYYVAGKRSNSKLNTKLLEIVGKVTGRPAISAIMLAADISTSEELAAKSLEEFAKVALPSIENSLDSIVGN